MSTGLFFYKKSKEDLQRLDNVSPSDYEIVKKGYKKAPMIGEYFFY